MAARPRLLIAPGTTAKLSRCPNKPSLSMRVSMTRSSQGEIDVAQLTLDAVRQRADVSALAWIGELGLAAAQAQQIASGLDADAFEMRVVGAQLLASWLSQQNGDLVSAAAIWKGLIELLLAFPLDSPLRAEMLVTSIMTYGANAINAGDGDALIERASGWSELLQNHRPNNTASLSRVTPPNAL